MSDRKPYVHVETQDGAFVGAISHEVGIPSQEKSWKREVSKFCGDAIARGNTITTLYSREEYQAFIDNRPLFNARKQGTLL